MDFTKTLFTYCFRTLRLAQDALTALFGGESCIRCGKAAGSTLLCAHCEELLQVYQPLSDAEKRCRLCGKILLSENSTCMQCRSFPVLLHTDGVFPLHAYRFWNKTLLHEWKSAGRRTLSPVFASLVYKALCELELASGSNLPVVPVPPRPGKIRRNGWDQIADLCFFLRQQYGVQVLPLLRRLSEVQQKHLGREERLSSLKQTYAFAPPDSWPRFHRKKRDIPPAVVLVDDVLTTGATIESCAKALKAGGVRTVYAITLFAVD